MRSAKSLSRGHLLARVILDGPSTSARHFSSTSSSAQWNVAKVPHRGVLEVSGRDTMKLLQGLVSNNVATLSSSASTPALLYAGFMNPQGRMLADIFIHAQPALPDGSPRWLLDLDSRTLPSLLGFVKKFKLRSKVTLRDASAEHHVVQSWSSSPSSIAPEEVVRRLSADPRCPDIGYRGVLSASQDLALGGETQEVEGEQYTVHRILNGVGEGALDFPEGSSLPLENNLDYMNGVDFRKGCYVGQELTARTHHTGVVRKRLIPLSFYLPGTPPPTHLAFDPNSSLPLPSHLSEVRSKPVSAAEEGKMARGKAAGKFTSGIGNVGLGCLRLEQVQRWGKEGEAGLLMETVAADVETQLMIRPWIPSWWPKQEQPEDGREE